MPAGEPERVLTGEDRLPAGRVIAGRYRLDAFLGAGGMGEVYRAWDAHLRRPVAVKRLRPRSPDDRQAYLRLLREGRASSPLDHPAIVKVYDVVQDGPEAYLIQELAQGEALRRRLDRPLDLEAFFTLAEDCLDALAAAATARIVHCDLKPENILVTTAGRARILDFGIAHHFHCPGGEAQEATGEITPATGMALMGGTPGYVPPELLDGRTPDARADIFSLGVVFYEMLTARHPFRRETATATIVAVGRDNPEPPGRVNPAVTRELDRLVLSMLAKDPALRPADPRALLIELRRARGAPGRRGRMLRVAGWPRRAWWALGAAAALLGAAVVWTVVRPDSGRVAAAWHVPYVVVEDFRGLSGDAPEEYLALGLTEAVRTRLAALEGIQVVEPRDDLGVKLALEGSVQREGVRVRVSYRLVNHATGLNVAGSVVEEDAGNLFALQDAVARDATRALAREFDLAMPAEPGGRPTLDLTAYDCYLQARGYLQLPADQQRLLAAEDLFRRARTLDGGFTLALAGLGETYWKMYEETRNPSWAAQAEAASRQALAEDPTPAEVHVTLGTILRGSGRAADAALEMRAALARDPRSAPAYAGLALAQQDLGDQAAAERTFLEAIAIRPGDWYFHSCLGGLYRSQSRYADAIAAFQRVVRLTPDYARGYSNLGAALVEDGRTAEGIAALERSLELAPNYRAYSNLAAAYTFGERREDAAVMYERALEINPNDCRVWGSLGSICRMLGREERAREAFHRARALAEQALAINPQDAELLALLAQYHGELGDGPAARLAMDRALGAAPVRGDVLFNVSATLELLEERDAALAMAARAVRAGYPVTAWRREPRLRALVADPRFEGTVADAQRAEAGANPSR